MSRNYLSDTPGEFVAHVTSYVVVDKAWMLYRVRGEIMFPDGIPRKWSLHFRDNPHDKERITRWSMIHVDLTDWRKRKDAAHIRRAILDSFDLTDPGVLAKEKK